MDNNTALLIKLTNERIDNLYALAEVNKDAILRLSKLMAETMEDIAKLLGEPKP